MLPPTVTPLAFYKAVMYRALRKDRKHLRALLLLLKCAHPKDRVRVLRLYASKMPDVQELFAHAHMLDRRLSNDCACYACLSYAACSHCGCGKHLLCEGCAEYCD